MESNEIRSCNKDITIINSDSTKNATFNKRSISGHTNAKNPNQKPRIGAKKIEKRAIDNVDQKHNSIKSISSSFIKGGISGITSAAVGAAGTAIGTFLLGPIGGIIGGIAGSAVGKAVGSAIGEKITE